MGVANCKFHFNEKSLLIPGYWITDIFVGGSSFVVKKIQWILTDFAVRMVKQ